jgi:archaeosine-15-forming tRNA-guanine transglycosylase
MIRARMIIELLGFPPDALKATLKKAIEQMKERVVIKKEFYAEPKKVGEKIFSSFVEFECEIKDFETLMGIVFDFGPSTIEILSPDEIKMKSKEIEHVLNDLVARIHEMDKQIKILTANNIILQKNINMLQQKSDENKNQQEEKEK